MTKTPPADERQRQNGKVLEAQPYSVDPAKTPKVGHDAAGPKRWQKKPGQALDDPDSDKDGN